MTKEDRKIHELKIQEEFADAVYVGDKTFELRYNDRGYQKGDLIKFQVMDGLFEENHLLNTKVFEITYVISGWGLKEGWVALAIREVEGDKE